MTYDKTREVVEKVIGKLDQKPNRPRGGKVPRWTMTALLAAGLSVSAVACDDDDDDDPDCPNCDYAMAFHESGEVEKKSLDTSDLPYINDEEGDEDPEYDPQDDEAP